MVPVASRREDSPQFLELDQFQLPMFDAMLAFEDELCHLCPRFIIRADRPPNCRKSSRSGGQQATQFYIVSLSFPHGHQRLSPCSASHGTSLSTSTGWNRSCLRIIAVTMEQANCEAFRFATSVPVNRKPSNFRPLIGLLPRSRCGHNIPIAGERRRGRADTPGFDRWPEIKGQQVTEFGVPPLPRKNTQQEARRYFSAGFLLFLTALTAC